MDFLSERAINFIVTRGCMPNTFSESETISKFWQQTGKNIPPSIIEWESKIRKLKEEHYRSAKPDCRNECTLKNQIHS